MTYDRAMAMLSYVGPYYKRSKIYRAQNDAKADELNQLRELVDEVANQFFLESATWGIGKWEEYCGLPSNMDESLKERRQKVATWLQIISPITPWVMKRICEQSLGIPVDIKENIAPYTFGIYFDLNPSVIISIPSLLFVIEEAKPAHLAVFYQVKIFAPDVALYTGGTVSTAYTTTIAPRLPTHLTGETTLRLGHYQSSVQAVVVRPKLPDSLQWESRWGIAHQLNSIQAVTVGPYQSCGIRRETSWSPAYRLHSVQAVTVGPLVHRPIQLAGINRMGMLSSTIQATKIRAKGET